MHRSPTILALLLLAPAALAQAPLEFAVDQASSNFTWSGTTSLGAIVGDPSTSFQLAGQQTLELAPGSGGAKWSASFLDGDLALVPDIHGKINNVLPFLPPLATVRVTNMHLSLSSTPFDVAPDGSFSALVTATVLSGSMTIVPLVGSPATTDLTGGSSTPTLQNGSLGVVGGSLQLLAPVNLTFDFDDPGSGVSGSLSTLGDVDADWSAPAPAAYCTAKTTSNGCLPTISGLGTASASATSGFTVQADQVEPGNLGIFFFSSTGTNSAPFQGGFLCLASPVKRLPPQPSGGAAACSGVYATDFNAYLAASQPQLRAPGAPFFVQCWFRDPPEPISGSGLSDALALVLGP